MDWRDYVRGGRRRIETTIAVLDRLSRQRALTLHESLQLEHAIRAQNYNERTWLLWHEDEDAAATALRERGLSYSAIARSIHRTPDAVAARLRCLRKRAETSGGEAAR